MALNTIPGGHTPLMAAAAGGNESIVLELIIRGANPSCSNSFGDTAFTVAKRDGHESAAPILEDAFSGSLFADD